MFGDMIMSYNFWPSGVTGLMRLFIFYLWWSLPQGLHFKGPITPVNWRSLSGIEAVLSTTLQWLFFLPLNPFSLKKILLELHTNSKICSKEGISSVGVFEGTYNYGNISVILNTDSLIIGRSAGGLCSYVTCGMQYSGNWCPLLLFLLLLLVLLSCFFFCRRGYWYLLWIIALLIM